MLAFLLSSTGSKGGLMDSLGKGAKGGGGRQWEAASKCHCKVLRDNIQEITKPAKCCLKCCGGVKHTWCAHSY